MSGEDTARTDKLITCAIRWLLIAGCSWLVSGGRSSWSPASPSSRAHALTRSRLRRGPRCLRDGVAEAGDPERARGGRSIPGTQWKCVVISVGLFLLLQAFLYGPKLSSTVCFWIHVVKEVTDRRVSHQDPSARFAQPVSWLGFFCIFLLLARPSVGSGSSPSRPRLLIPPVRHLLALSFLQDPNETLHSSTFRLSPFPGLALS